MIDSFLYNGEILHLILRLNTLANHADSHVIIEGGRTFQGNAKSPKFPSDFKKYRKQMEPFAKKLHYIWVDIGPMDETAPVTLPDTEYLEHLSVKTHMIGIIKEDKVDPWEMEKIHRNMLMHILSEIPSSPETIIMVSDVDEIPNPNVIYNFTDAAVLIVDTFYYDLQHRTKEITFGPALTRLKHLSSPAQLRNTRYDFSRIPEGGWHFSFFTGIDGIVDKLKSYSHTEYNSPDFTGEMMIKERIRTNQDILCRPGFGFHNSALPLFGMPSFIQEQPELFESWHKWKP